MKLRKSTAIHYKKIKDEMNIIPEEQLLNIIGVNDDSFLNINPASRGVITNELIRLFNLKTPKEMKHKDIWLKLTVDSWISAFYEIAMKEREEAIMGLQEKLTKEKRRRNDIRAVIGACGKQRKEGAAGIGKK
jgi:hypothetical protein